MSLIEVVMPVYNEIEYTTDIFKMISENTIVPNVIHLIDNSNKDNYKPLVELYSDKLNINYLKQKENIGVNPAWNLGISLCQSEYISILNNDIVITPFFFEMIYKTFKLGRDIGMVIPTTVLDKEKVMSVKELPRRVKLAPYIRREGWAFTLRTSALKNIKPIPPQFKIFCGDDYLFLCMGLSGHKVVKVANNLIYHYKSITVSKLRKEGKIIKGISGTMLTEKEYWNKLKPELRKYYNKDERT